MSFLARIFGRRYSKPKEIEKEEQTVVISEASDSEDDALVKVEETGFIQRRRTGCDLVGPLPRRQGGELQRSKTSVDHVLAPSARSSISSNSEGAADECLTRTYRRIRQLCRGRNANILEAYERKTARQVVIKAFPKQGMSLTRLEKIEREVELLHRVAACPGVVRCLNFIQDHSHTYTVLEACAGQTLIELVANSGGKLVESRCAAEVALPLTQTIAALHASGVVHRNIKPEHIICSSNNIKLLDFLDAADMWQQCLNYRTGQIEYSAPEVLNKPRAEDIFHQVLFHGMAEEDLPQYNAKADVWSIGVVVFEALTGYQPFVGESAQEVALSQQQQLSRVQGDGLPEFIARHGLSNLAESFLLDSLQLDPEKRANAAELLLHPWICDIKRTSRQFNESGRRNQIMASQSMDGSPYVQLPQRKSLCMNTTIKPLMSTNHTSLSVR